MVVTKIEKNGFLRFANVGHPHPLTLSGRNVLVNGSVKGVVGAKTLHITTPEERKKVPEYRDHFVDVGVEDDKEIAEMGIRVGSPIVITNDFLQLGKGTVYAGKALDDRLACVLLVLLFEAIQGEELAGPVHGCFTVQEEVGLRGAQMSAYKVNPDFAVSLDVSVAEDTPDMPEPSASSIKLGKGPVIGVLENVPDKLLGTIHHPGMVEYMIDLAKKNNIPYQIGSIIGGATDAATIHLSRGGVPTVWIGTPTRYLHSQVETLELKDIKLAVDLLAAFVRSIKPETGFNLVE
jgi:endoglucanase